MIAIYKSIMFTKINSDTSLSLSFHKLKQENLIKNYNEYQSIHSMIEMAESEHFPLINSKFVKSWLKNQNTFFRKSYLSYLLISGFSRISNKSKPSLFNKEFVLFKVIPKDIQNMILSYTNLIFIKIYQQKSNAYSLLSVDCNFTINNLCKILEIQHGKMCKISTKFDANFGSIFKDGRYKHLNQGQNLYIDLPKHIGSKLTLKQMDDGLERDKILEFHINESLLNEDDINNKSHFEWLCSLKFGDIVDVYNDCYNEWVEGVIIKRDFDTFHIDCINVNDKYNHKYNQKDMNIIKIRSIGLNNLDCLQRRYSHCKQKKLYHPNDNMLLFCDWTYYPVLIE